MPSLRPVALVVMLAVSLAGACSDTEDRPGDAGGAPTDGASADSGGGTVDSGGGTADSGGATADSGGGGGLCPGYVAAPAGSTPCRTTEECPPSGFGPVFCVPTDYVPPPLCGGPAPPPSCTTDADCEAFGGGWTRCGQNPRPGCGGPLACAPPCSSDPECAPGERCLPTGLCEALRCPDDHPCEAGWRCDASDPAADAHGCAPVGCSEGFACPDSWVCDPAPDPHVVPDAHGCRPLDCFEIGSCPINTRCDPTPAGYRCQRLGCSRDDECDCGACVANNCVAGPGYCYAQPPPPP